MLNNQMRELERQHNVVSYEPVVFLTQSLANIIDSPDELWEEKVGYDSANKRMVAKIYGSLYYIIEKSTLKPTWTNVVRHMLTMNNKLGQVNINGYYGTICRILKDIKVIKYEGSKLVKAENWNRFYSDEDWSWFITSTWAGGYGKIIK